MIFKPTSRGCAVYLVKHWKCSIPTIKDIHNSSLCIFFARITYINDLDFIGKIVRVADSNILSAVDSYNICSAILGKIIGNSYSCRMLYKCIRCTDNFVPEPIPVNVVAVGNRSSMSVKSFVIFKIFTVNSVSNNDVLTAYIEVRRIIISITPVDTYPC